MGLFTRKSQKKKPPKGPIEGWTHEDVLQWLQYRGLERYEAALRSITGKRLLALTQADLFQLLPTKLDADILSDAVSELRSGQPVVNGSARRGSGLPGSPAAGGAASWQAQPAGSHFTPQSSMNLDSVSRHSAGSVDHVLKGDGGLRASPAKGTSPLRSGTSSRARPSISSPIATAHKTVAENAEVLASLAGGHDASSELFLYFTKLHIQGSGLVDAAERTPMVAHIVERLATLRDLAQYAKGSRLNCMQLDAFGQDIMRAFDFHGKRLAFVDSKSLDELAALLKRACGLMEAAGQPGWLLRMATDERSHDDFVGVHNGILDLLQAQRVNVLSSGRPLGYGDYKDCCRPLRRLLKQYGSGSLEAGLQFVKTNGNALSELVALLNVDRPALKRELDGVSPGLDLAGMNSASLGTGGASNGANGNGASAGGETAAIFATYDRSHAGALGMEELRQCLADLGTLDGVKPGEMDGFLAAQFAAADADRDGAVGPADFAAYYGGLGVCRARQQLRTSMGVEAEKDLRKVFVDFASFGSRQTFVDMDGAKFFKLCKDTRLVNRTFTVIDVDIIFAKVKTKGSRRVTFEQFLMALAAVADAKRTSLEAVVRQVLASQGPVSSGTRADYVKFHDDKSLYTGVYARGGPSVEESSSIDLPHYLDRSEADVRGVKKQRSPGGNVLSDDGGARNNGDHGFSGGRHVASADGGSLRNARGTATTPTSSTPLSKPPSTFGKAWSDAPVSDEEVLAAFKAFASWGGGTLSPGRALEMDGARFAKLCRESGVQGGKLNSIAIDIIFSKVKAKGARKIGLREFESAFLLLAEERGCSVDDVRAMVAGSGGPRSNGVTQAATVRLHDDKSTYTGVYAAKASPTRSNDAHLKADSTTPPGERFRTTV